MKSVLNPWVETSLAFPQGKENEGEKPTSSALSRVGIKGRSGRLGRTLLNVGAAIILGGGLVTPSMSQPPPQVGLPTASQHNFLTFQSGNLESPDSSKAYYNTIDPGATKQDFKVWLQKAGFISDVSQWKPTGQQTFTDVPGDYGFGKINAYAHIIILNAADLGFIRNQYIRCNPDCLTKNATIYTYLENYVPPQNADILTTQKAINVALEKREGRIADVAFEWTPDGGTNPSSLFGKIYAYVVQPKFKPGTIVCGAGNVPTGTPTGSFDEFNVWPSDGGNNQAFWDCALNTLPFPTPSINAQGANPDFLHPRPDVPVYSGDPFAPQLDNLGTKANPGVCMICHGGNLPANIQFPPHTWPNGGNVQEFKFLPADAHNSIFGTDDTAAPLVASATGSDLSEAGQKFQLKRYNQAVLITQGATPPKNGFFQPEPDGSIAGGNWTFPTVSSIVGGVKTKRPTHGVEVILGLYAGFDGDLSMSNSTFIQNQDFVPVGWRTTAESVNLYQKVVGPFCRTCHMNREPSLDFGTQAQFDSNKGNVQDFVFQPECDALLNEIKPDKIVMPLAKLTWDRFWRGVDGNKQTNALNLLAANDPSSPAFLLKKHFGYTATSFCASKH
jgi:hypothetical protein